MMQCTVFVLAAATEVLDISMGVLAVLIVGGGLVMVFQGAIAMNQKDD